MSGAAGVDGGTLPRVERSPWCGVVLGSAAPPGYDETMRTNRRGSSSAPQSHAHAAAGRTPVLEIAVFDGARLVVRDLPSLGIVSIGRDEDNDVRIEHGSVSRHHALLHIGPPLRIEDLGGTNPTLVRAVRSPAEAGKTEDVRQVSRQAVDIALGDTITMGNVTMVIRGHTHAELPEDGDVIVCDPITEALFQRLSAIAEKPISVLLLGETGTGKEVLANAIHRRSPRARGPFVAFNCAELPETLVESELFGCVKGAYTHAVPRPGLFEFAHGGTLFLDEVGELSTSVQAKLLRVLEERQVRRIGERIPRSIDVRFISATNRDLEVRVTSGAFRQDLYYRLKGVALVVPPLRERPLDIAPLARALTARACQSSGSASVPALAPETLAALERYRWPGNVRELRQAMEHAIAFCRGDTLLPEHLPPEVLAPSPHAYEPPEPAVESGAPRSTPSPSKKARLLSALEKHGWNVTRAAREIAVSRRTAVYWIKELRLQRPGSDVKER